MRRVGKYSKVKQAVIFCGGAGSRLGSITKRVPKPLIRLLINLFRKYNFPIFAIWCGRGSLVMFLQERIIFQKISQKKTI